MNFRFSTGTPIQGFVLMISMVIIGGAGCGPSTPPDRSNMMDEVLGALQIQGKSQRDKALAEACRQSAEAGDGFAVLQGLPRIERDSLRNEVATECADLLQSSGKLEEALDAANLITEEQQRDDLVKQLETGS